ncbi:integrase [Nakamurella sp. UYEF19]|uniref:tyrosine-type recombinase/integrase n=1 Tax=Nakamurella sp. UYEF19 TaxID=1756392 RepID=UPI0033932114
MAAIYIGRKRWTDPVHAVNVLFEAILIARQYGYTELADFPDPPSWSSGSPRARAEATFPGRPGEGTRVLVLALLGMKSLVRNWCHDPWDSDVWHHADLGIASSRTVTRPLVHWTSVTIPGLREGLKSLSRQQVQSGRLAWGTIGSHVRAGGLLSHFAGDQAGTIRPADINRKLFLDFVCWVRNRSSVDTDFHAINTLASGLRALRENELVSDLPDTSYLLRGENPIRKVRKPKPFPPDILDAIDNLIATGKALDDGSKLLLRVFRAAGPRASEALLLTRDNIRYTNGRGYSLEYFQTKTDTIRAIPIPDQLGKDLTAQAALVVKTYGRRCTWLFPKCDPSPSRRTLTPRAEIVGPWAYRQFSDMIWTTYQRAGITTSAITGEHLTRAQLHRFRHTIATGLLREGWSQYEVQKFLGHSSPTMMQAYAEIHEEDLRDKYVEFVTHAIDVDGRRHQTTVAGAAQVERLRDRLIRTTLPNGYCTLPEKQTCDFVPTPCLSCKPFFRTTPVFLPIHIRQRDESLVALESAKADGRERAVAALERTVTNLDTIIDGLAAQTPATT